MFIIDESYSKNDLYRILNVPIKSQKGSWNTGYILHKDNIFIFCNIGIPGRTGHDYANRWDDEGNLIWYGKNRSNISQPLIRRLLNSSNDVFIFIRTDSSLPFTYKGKGILKNFKDTTPVEIVWSFKEELFNHPIILPEEITNPLFEGSTVKISVNRYERNLVARTLCIEHFGCFCQICNFNFKTAFGEIGKDFIHVHHLKQLSEIEEKYIIDPINDLIPVCPNCHAIIHRKNPAYTVNEIKKLLDNSY